MKLDFVFNSFLKLFYLSDLVLLFNKLGKKTLMSYFSTYFSWYI